MDQKERDAWNARPMVVTVKEHCLECKTLQGTVEPREYASYWPTVSLKLTSCAPCFEIAKQKAITEAKAESSAYC
ncbi:hypothetical protein SAMN05216466_107129 [Paraburkholderia phenazinium]|uniref:Uncharacterized protein n=1 Tax=Paraburkholderia phenazinium TaxID=60549 RepID=A0A1G7ZQQ5_9BURK|nr:hypothetical protein SAMN05216466_107129 [Paraburkholderia phenazinium]